MKNLKGLVASMDDLGSTLMILGILTFFFCVALFTYLMSSIPAILIMHWLGIITVTL